MSVQSIMTPNPACCTPSTSLQDVAKMMIDNDCGQIPVVAGDGSNRPIGVVTDRDIVVRVVADGTDPSTAKVRDAATMNPVTLTVDQSVDDAIRVMREQDIRRIPVVQDNRPAGIVSLGDLAIERDTDSALADIASEPPNN
jgi:CBS domain-containing protein